MCWERGQTQVKGSDTLTHCEATESLPSATIAKILSWKQKHHSQALSYFKLLSPSPRFFLRSHIPTPPLPGPLSLGCAAATLPCGASSPLLGETSSRKLCLPGTAATLQRVSFLQQLLRRTRVRFALFNSRGSRNHRASPGSGRAAPARGGAGAAIPKSTDRSLLFPAAT